MIRVTRQIKCLIAQAPGGHTPPPTWSELYNGWDVLLIYKTKPNDFDLQLGCYISDAFSIFFY